MRRSVVMLGSRQYAVPRVTMNCGRLGILIGSPFGIGMVNDGSPADARLASKASCVSKPGAYTLLKSLTLIRE